ncbi:MAG: dihydrodipicolinate synthase family protein [Armatimonadota bacterium]
MDVSKLRSRLLEGGVIPAHPLALTAERRLDETAQRNLTSYYIAAGAHGVAVGVHTTQFAIRKPEIGLYEPVLALAADGMRDKDIIKIAGGCGPTEQALAEAETAKRLGYDAVLLSLGGLATWTESALLDHCRAVANVIPVIGFYLQPAVGGRALSRHFWRMFFQIDNVVAVKVAPFNRYQTLDVIHALAESGRTNVALYTGNDDAIIHDLITPFIVGDVTLRFCGGLLGHWSVWTRSAVDVWKRCREAVELGSAAADLLADAAAVTELNRVLFDADNGFAGCIAGIHDVLMRQGLMAGTWCLDPQEGMSAGQAEALRDLEHRYPHLTRF